MRHSIWLAAIAILAAGCSGGSSDVAQVVCNGLRNNVVDDLDSYIQIYANLWDINEATLSTQVWEKCPTAAKDPSASSGLTRATTRNPTTQATANSGVPTDPLDQMEIAFIGSYSRRDIKSEIDVAMGLYDLSLTDDNYSRAGSVLVTLRKQYGPSEMDILDYMIASYVSGVNLSFPDAAAISVAFLVAGDS